jgi:D-methionine transport system ATP-binding protein
VVELKHVTKVFETEDGEFTALKDVNLTVADGDIYGIIGMSGAGKSTLVRCINMLERPTEGEILIDGRDVCRMNAAELRAMRRNVTMIFQQFNLLMQRTCLRNVCFPMELSGVKPADAKKRAMELLETVGLPDKANVYPAQLSGGQMQRIAIARALASDPKVLLCDEATSALDPKTTHSILSLIQDINKRLGITAIIITHQMSVVEEVCNNVAILDDGVVVEKGKVTDIFANPKTEAAKRLVFSAHENMTTIPANRVVRVVFNGGTAYDPLIASLAIDCGIKVNILGANTKNVGGQAFGYMLLGLPDNEDEAARALAYIRKQPGVNAEEAPDYHVG